MNIDIDALRAIETERGVPVTDLLTSVASGLLYAYSEYRDGNIEENHKSRVDIDADTGEVAVIVTEVNEEGEVITEFDDTPTNFSRVAAPAVRDAIFKRLREVEADRAYDSYAELQGTVVSGVVQQDSYANNRGIVIIQLGTEIDIKEGKAQDGILLPAEQIPGGTTHPRQARTCFM